MRRAFCLALAVALSAAPAAAGTLAYQFDPDAGPAAPGAIVVFPSPPASADRPWTIPATTTDDPQGISAIFYNLGGITPGAIDVFMGPATDVNIALVSPAGGVPDAGAVFYVPSPETPIVVLGMTFGPDSRGTLSALYDDQSGAHLFTESGTWAFTPVVPEPPSALLLGLGAAAVGVVVAGRR